MKKIVIGVLILILVGLGIVGFYFKYQRDVKIIPVEVSLKESRIVEFLSEAHVSDFIDNIDGELVDDFLVDTTVVGNRKIEYTAINKDGKKVKQSFDITILDTVPPVVWLGASYSVTVGSNVNLTEKILCGDNYDSSPNCEVIGEYDMEKVGTYPLVFKATDNSGNETSINFNLYVKEPSMSKPSTPTETKFLDVVKKYKNENTSIGIDISEWQDEPDYQKLKDAGVEFVILRVGGSKYSTGEYFLDKSFLYNIEEAEKVGLPVGIYFYSYAKDKKRALEDAEWIYEQIKDKKVELPIFFDWENWSFYNEFKLSFYELTDMSNSFLKFFEDKGYDGMLYSSKAYLEEIWLKSNYPIWMAHYTKNIEKSSYQGEYTYWQLCSDGKVDGIDGPVDINVRFNN